MVSGGRDGCQALFDELTAQAFADPAYAVWRELAFDTYCMQHLESYCRSVKSYAAHLTRLCCGLEYGGDPRIYKAIQKWLNGAIGLEKPPLLSQLGSLTVAEVRQARTAEEHAQRVHDWAALVWDAYQAQHDIARAWIKAALAATEGTLPKRN